MVENKQLSVTLEGPGAAEGSVPVSDLIAALEGVQDAMRLMVGYLGGRTSRQGRPAGWVRDQSALRLMSTQPGSFVAELALESPASGQGRFRDYGSQAFDALKHWDGSEDSTLPRSVTARLYQIPSALPDDMQVWLGDADDRRRVQVMARDRLIRPGPGIEEALLHGWLKAVNWDKRTAQLHRYKGDYVRLRFDAALDEEMLRSATHYVEVRGYGRLNAKDEWTSILVKQVNATRSWAEPFDLDSFLEDPNPKIFDPDKTVTASEPFDVDEFIRVIHEGRDAGLKESSD